MNDTGKIKVKIPEVARLNFVSNRWQKHDLDDDDDGAISMIIPRTFFINLLIRFYHLNKVKEKMCIAWQYKF